ncbi:MAG: 4Fe-4S dicluster domain-containing protein [Anaerolineae bacterium]|nr:4Fe-4S dicluster domain-containing protein [Anaerolineae bacterium]
MSTRVDPSLLDEIKEYGAVNTEACFNCGNCTAICPLTDDGHPFPRSTIRLLQMGLRDRLLESTDPWMCYYCGDCTTTCPKGAEPSETIMSARRWLSAKYDRSGHGSTLYTSEKALVWAILRAAIQPLVLIIIYHLYLLLTDNSPDLGLTADGVVPVNAFAPGYLIWDFVLAHFVLLGYRLFRNALHMFTLVMGTNPIKAKISLAIYIGEFKEFIIHLSTQKRWRDCGEDRGRWLKHLLLVTGYLTMLALVVVLLGWFQTDNIYPLYHPQRWLGYYATIVLILMSSEALIGRYRKRDEIHRFSHPTDWLFPSFILIGAVTGILINIFRYAYWPWATYIIYLIHFMAMMAMLDTEVGIGKWTHLIYRPLALYLDAVKKRAAQSSEVSPAPAPAGD